MSRLGSGSCATATAARNATERFMAILRVRSLFCLCTVLRQDRHKKYAHNWESARFAGLILDLRDPFPRPLHGLETQIHHGRSEVEQPLDASFPKPAISHLGLLLH